MSRVTRWPASFTVRACAAGTMDRTAAEAVTAATRAERCMAARVPADPGGRTDATAHHHGSGRLHVRLDDRGPELGELADARAVRATHGDDDLRLIRARRVEHVLAVDVPAAILPLLGVGVD